jgi:hypothetical protein
LFGVGFAYAPPIIYDYFNLLSAPSIIEFAERTVIIGLAVFSGLLSRKFVESYTKLKHRVSDR